MTIQEITQLMGLFDGSTAQSMKLSQGDFSLELSRGQSDQVVAPVSAVVQPTPVQSAAPAGSVVKAPLVGTYYAAPSPDAPPFIAVGQTVKKGEVLCLIEAMKMMSEITAPCDCVIQSLLQENGALVAFDAPIVEYTPC